MATRRYGISLGSTSVHVTQAVGAATVSKNLEVTIDLAVGIRKPDAMKMLEEVVQYIKANPWPPA